MSKHFENFVMNVFPWRTITICLIVIAVCELMQTGQGFVH
jgi:hypothetical protein